MIPALLDGSSILDPQQIAFPRWPYRGSSTWSPTAGFDDGGLAQFADAIVSHLHRKAR
jgi:hypothetical protein